MPLELASSAFSDRGEIPVRHTCEGADTSPPLAWTGVPTGAKSLALIVYDPDAPDPAAPRTTWVHWVVFDIPPGATGLAEGAKPPPGAQEGLNDWGTPGYRGPCPPVGSHRYFHRLYALDVILGSLAQPTKARIEAAMRGHVIASAQLVGTYRKAR